MTLGGETALCTRSSEQGLSFLEHQNCKIASVEEVSSLIKSGCEYVTEMEGVKLFRKRKQLSIKTDPRKDALGKCK